MRKHQHAGMPHIRIGVHASAAVLAGVFHIDGKSAQVLKHDLGSQTAVAAGAGCGDQDFALGNSPFRQKRGYVRLEGVAGQVKIHRVPQRQRLLVDFAQHFMFEEGHGFYPETVSR